MLKLAYYSLITAMVSAPVHVVADGWPTRALLIGSLACFISFLAAGLSKGP
jgi:hypothetical protein